MRTRLLFIVFLGKIQYIYGHFERYRKTEAGNRKKGRTYHEISRRFRSAILFDSRKHPRTNQSFHPKTTLGIRILLSHAPVFVSIHLGSLHRLPRLGCILPIFTHDNRILLFYKRNDPFCKSATGKKIENRAWNPDRQCTIEYQGNSTFSVIESFNTQINKGDSFQVEHFYLHQPLILTNLCRRITPTSFSEPINYAIGYQTGLTSIQLLE